MLAVKINNVCSEPRCSLLKPSRIYCPTKLQLYDLTVQLDDAIGLPLTAPLGHLGSPCSASSRSSGVQLDEHFSIVSGVTSPRPSRASRGGMQHAK